VLANLHLLDLLTETRTIASPVLANNAHLLCALRLQAGRGMRPSVRDLTKQKSSYAYVRLRSPQASRMLRLVPPQRALKTLHLKYANQAPTLMTRKTHHFGKLLFEEEGPGLLLLGVLTLCSTALTVEEWRPKNCQGTTRRPRVTTHGPKPKPLQI
jgi:hypothetical protein